MNNKLTSSDDDNGFSNHHCHRRRTKCQVISSEDEDKESDNPTEEDQNSLTSDHNGHSRVDISSNFHKTLRRSRRLISTYQELKPTQKYSSENVDSHTSDEEFQLKSRKRKSNRINSKLTDSGSDGYSSDEESQLKSRKIRSNRIKNPKLTDFESDGLETLQKERSSSSEWEFQNNHRRSNRLKAKQNLLPELPTKLSLLNNIKTTPNGKKELDYFKMNRLRVNNLVQWYEN
jgi:hypothetical protein